MSQIKCGDWVTTEHAPRWVGCVKRVARDGTWADVNWHSHSKRMPTHVLSVQHTLQCGDWQITDETRKAEREQPLTVIMLDPIIHTDEHPKCGTSGCPCEELDNTEPCHVCGVPVSYVQMGGYGDEIGLPACAYCDMVVCEEHSFVDESGHRSCYDARCIGVEYTPEQLKIISETVYWEAFGR